MWFAKWFGGRSDRDDEPARFAPPAPKSVTPAKRVQENVGSPQKLGVMLMDLIIRAHHGVVANAVQRHIHRGDQGLPERL